MTTTPKTKTPKREPITQADFAAARKNKTGKILKSKALKAR